MHHRVARAPVRVHGGEDVGPRCCARQEQTDQTQDRPHPHLRSVTRDDLEQGWPILTYLALEEQRDLTTPRPMCYQPSRNWCAGGVICALQMERVSVHWPMELLYR